MGKKMKLSRCPMSADEFIQKTDLINEESRQDNDGNYQYCELSGISIENKRLCNSSFNFSKLSGIVFTDIDLERAEFNFSELDNVKFVRCKLDSSAFDYASMKKVVFENCMMEGCTFDFADGEAAFSDCKMAFVEFHHSMASIAMKNCAGEKIQLSYSPRLTVNAENCDFHGGKFIDSSLCGTMKNCILTDASFNGTDASGASFMECRMRDIELLGSRGVDVTGENDDDDDFEMDF